VFRELRDDAKAVREWSRGNTDLFAGMWFDNEAASGHPLRSRLGVGIVGDVEHVTNELSELLAHPEALFVVGMRWTRAELDAFREQVAAELLLPGPPSSGGDVIGVGADESRNRVTVQLSSQNDRLAAEISARYSDEVVVVESPPPGVIMRYTAV
jgi:hypothetical protein